MGGPEPEVSLEEAAGPGEAGGLQPGWRALTRHSISAVPDSGPGATAEAAQQHADRDQWRHHQDSGSEEEAEQRGPAHLAPHPATLARPGRRHSFRDPRSLRSAGGRGPGAGWAEQLQVLGPRHHARRHSAVSVMSDSAAVAAVTSARRPSVMERVSTERRPSYADPQVPVCSCLCPVLTSAARSATTASGGAAWRGGAAASASGTTTSPSWSARTGWRTPAATPRVRGARHGTFRLNNFLSTFLFLGHDIVLKLFLELQDPNHPYR